MNDLGNKEIMARNIQYYMDKNGKTRKDMCEALGVKYSTFTEWVTANAYPRIDKIELMANYFGIDKSDLVEDHTKTSILKKKDEKDIAKRLESTLSDLENMQEELMFSGEPLDSETCELLKASLENSIRIAKINAKQKFTPNKFKNTDN